MARQILLPHGKKNELMRMVHCTYPTVRAALRFRSDSATARKIRFVAVKHLGGYEVETL